MSFYRDQEAFEKAVNELYTNEFKRVLTERLDKIAQTMIKGCAEEAAMRIKVRAESARDALRMGEEIRMYIKINDTDIVDSNG